MPQIQALEITNLRKDPYYKKSLVPWTKNKMWNDRDPLIQFHMKFGPPVAGIDIYEHFEVRSDRSA